MARVLVISPHPDDEAIGCAGTLCAHIKSGDDVQIVFLTSGEQGGHGRSPEDTAKMREQEAAAAAEILSVSDFEFWRQPDGCLAVTADLVERLQETIHRWRPHWIYVTHHREMHADHRAAAELVQLASRSVRQEPGECIVRMYEVWTPLQEMDDVIDISDYMDQKLAAVRAHQTQCEAMQFDDAVAGLNRYRGEMHSWPGGPFAEAFLRMRP